jgi:hypothetical protein
MVGISEAPFGAWPGKTVRNRYSVPMYTGRKSHLAFSSAHPSPPRPQTAALFLPYGKNTLSERSEPKGSFCDSRIAK